MAVASEAKLYAALGNETRLRILDLVSAHREMCACELVDELGMSQANVSRHIAVLRDAGALTDRRLGTLVVLRVDADALGNAFRTLTEGIAANHARSASEDVEGRLAGRCHEVTPSCA